MHVLERAKCGEKILFIWDINYVAWTNSPPPRLDRNREGIRRNIPYSSCTLVLARFELIRCVRMRNVQICLLALVWSFRLQINVSITSRIELFCRFLLFLWNFLSLSLHRPSTSYLRSKELEEKNVGKIDCEKIVFDFRRFFSLFSSLFVSFSTYNTRILNWFYRRLGGFDILLHVWLLLLPLRNGLSVYIFAESVIVSRFSLAVLCCVSLGKWNYSVQTSRNLASSQQLQFRWETEIFLSEWKTSRQLVDFTCSAAMTSCCCSHRK